MNRIASACKGLTLAMTLAWPLAMAAPATDARLDAKAEPKVLPDPTRPPPGVEMNPNAGGVQGAAPANKGPGANAAPASEGATEAKVPTRHLELQSVRVDGGGRGGVAVINDEVVSVGDKIAGMRVVGISRHEVRLQGASGQRRLRLLPDMATSNSQEPDPPPGGKAEPKAGRQPVERADEGDDEAGQQADKQAEKPAPAAKRGRKETQ
jgi:hypothetical protein